MDMEDKKDSTHLKAMQNPICETKMSAHSDKLKMNMVTRLKRIEGQVRGVSRMIDEDVYCDDVLNQIFSIESALNGVKRVMLEAHIKDCIKDQVLRGDESIINELLITMGKMIK